MRSNTHVVSHGHGEMNGPLAHSGMMINSSDSVSNGGHGIRYSGKPMNVDKCEDNLQSVCETNKVSHCERSSWKPLKFKQFNENQNDSNCIFYNLSQSYDVFDQFSQMYEAPVEQYNNNDDFELYSLSDSDDDNFPETNKSESTNNPSTTTKVYYSVASTKEEILSAFCNTADDSSSEDADDKSDNLRFPLKPGNGSQKALEQAASARGLRVYINTFLNPKTYMYNAKAVAGRYIVTQSSDKAKIAKQMASLKLLDILRQKCPLADSTGSFKDFPDNQKLPLHFLSRLPSSQSSSSTTDSSSCSPSTPARANNLPMVEPQLPTPGFHRTRPVLNASFPVKDQYSLGNGLNTASQVGSPADHIVPVLHSQPSKSPPFTSSKHVVSRQSSSSDRSITSNPKFILNPTGLLQECMMKMKRPLPIYSCASKSYGGCTSFECTVQANDVSARGCGSNKKEARKNASQNCLTFLDHNRMLGDVLMDRNRRKQ